MDSELTDVCAQIWQGVAWACAKKVWPFETREVGWGREGGPLLSQPQSP